MSVEAPSVFFLVDAYALFTDCRIVIRDVRERGRDIEGCIKQWFAFVKPNFLKFVEPQRNVAGTLCSSPIISLHTSL